MKTTTTFAPAAHDTTAPAASGSAARVAAAPASPTVPAAAGHAAPANPAPEAGTDARPGFRARLADSGLGKFLSSAFTRHATTTAPDPLAAAQARIAELEARVSKHAAALKKARAERDSATAQVVALCGPLGVKPAELASLDSAQIRTHVATALGRAAREKLAEIGQPLATVPTATVGTGEDLESLRAQLSETRDPIEAGRLTSKIKQLKSAARAAKS